MLKENNINWHYQTKNSLEYSQLTGKHHSAKLGGKKKKAEGLIIVDFLHKNNKKAVSQISFWVVLKWLINSQLIKSWLSMPVKDICLDKLS